MAMASSPKSVFSNDEGDEGDVQTKYLQPRTDWSRSKGSFDSQIISSSGSPHEFNWSGIATAGSAIVDRKTKLDDLLPRVDSCVEKLLRHAESKQFALGYNFVREASQDLAKKKDEAFAAMALATRSGVPPSDPDFARVHRLEEELDRYMCEAVRLHSMARQYNDEMVQWRKRVEEIELERSQLLEIYKTSRRQNQLFEAVARPDVEVSSQPRTSKSLSPKKTSNKLAAVVPKAPTTPRPKQGSPRPPPHPSTQTPFANLQREGADSSCRSAVPSAVVLAPLALNQHVSSATCEHAVSQQKPIAPSLSASLSASLTSAPALASVLTSRFHNPVGETSQAVRNSISKEISHLFDKLEHRGSHGSQQNSMHGLLDDLGTPKPRGGKVVFACEEQVSDPEAAGKDTGGTAIALSSDGKISIDLASDGHILERGHSRFFNMQEHASDMDHTKQAARRYRGSLEVHPSEDKQFKLGMLDQRLNSLKCHNPNSVPDNPKALAEKQEKKYLAEINDLEEKLRRTKQDLENLRSHNANSFTKRSWMEEFFLLCMTDLRRHMQQSLNPKPDTCHLAPMDTKHPLLSDGNRYEEVLRRLVNSEDIVTLLYEQMFPHRTAYFNIKNRSRCRNRHRTLALSSQRLQEGNQNGQPPIASEMENILRL